MRFPFSTPVDSPLKCVCLCASCLFSSTQWCGTHFRECRLYI